MNDELEWPPLPDICSNDSHAEVKKLLYQAKLDVIKAARQADLDIHKAKIAADIERQKADWAHEYATAQSVHNAYLEVGKKEGERFIGRAEFIQKVVAAVSSAYVAVLALSFAVNKSPPARGIIPTFFW